MTRSHARAMPQGGGGCKSPQQKGLGTGGRLYSHTHAGEQWKFLPSPDHG